MIAYSNTKMCTECVLQDTITKSYTIAVEFLEDFAWADLEISTNTPHE